MKPVALSKPEDASVWPSVCPHAAQHVRPRIASPPSLAMRGTMPKPATESAHHIPNKTQRNTDKENKQ
jgi:hypothetical protein